MPKTNATQMLVSALCPHAEYYKQQTPPLPQRQQSSWLLHRHQITLRNDRCNKGANNLPKMVTLQCLDHKSTYYLLVPVTPNLVDFNSASSSWQQQHISQ